MSSLNQVVLIGRAGQDPESKTVGTGNVVAKISLATSKRYKDKDGNNQESTTWHNVIAWNAKADLLSRFVSKGDRLGVVGELQTRSYEANDGGKRYVTEVVAKDFIFLSDSRTSRGSDNGPSFSGSGDNDFDF